MLKVSFFRVHANALLRVVSGLVLSCIPLKSPSNPLKGFVNTRPKELANDLSICAFKEHLFWWLFFFSFPALKELCFPAEVPLLTSPFQFQPSAVFIYLGFTLCQQHKNPACSHKTQEVPRSRENINITLPS